MEKCHYCEDQFHPMPRYALPGFRPERRLTPDSVRYAFVPQEVAEADKARREAEAEVEEENPAMKPHLIFVCEGILSKKGDCKERAIADGYERRGDLTPHR